MTSADERVARNQLHFRELNAQLRNQASRVDDAATAAFICECADEGCIEALQIPLSLYERVREHPRRFFVLDGHEERSAETIVFRGHGIVVVEKTGSVGRLVEDG
jgi:hypothetical protein